MAKRKQPDFLQTPDDFQIRMPGKSTAVQEMHPSVDGEMSYEFFESLEPDQDLLEELSPLIRLNNRKLIKNKLKKPKMVDEQVFNSKVIMIKSSRSSQESETPAKSSVSVWKLPRSSQDPKIPAEDHKDFVSQPKVFNGFSLSPEKPAAKTPAPEEASKPPKVKFNLGDSGAGHASASQNQTRSSPKVTLQLRAGDPKLLSDSNFQAKVRRFRGQTGDSTSQESFQGESNLPVNYFGKNEPFNSRVGSFSAEKAGRFGKKEAGNYNNCHINHSNNNSRNSSNLNRAPTEISENLVSTTTESTRSRGKNLNRLHIMADIFWGMMDKMKERSSDIEFQAKRPAPGSFKDFGKQPTVEELKLRLTDQEKQIRQLQEANKDLTEKLRKEKLAGNQLRINFMRYQKQVIELKNEVSAKTELMNEIYDASLKLRRYFELGVDFDDEEDFRRHT